MAFIKNKLLIALLIVVTLVAGSLFSGYHIISFSDFISGNWDPLTGDIILGFRLPRIMVALVIGSSLAVSGTIFQAVLKNPLADPFIIGVSGGAALGASLGITLSLDYIFVLLFSLAGSLCAINVVYFISLRKNFGENSLILSGVALSFILSSGVLIIFAFSSSDKVHKAVMWLMGDLSLARYDMLKYIGLLCAILLIVSQFFHKHLDVISFGRSFSENMGVGRGSVSVVFFTASLLSALSVSLGGVVGFVGLVVPHVVRNITGPSHLRLLPLAALGGALFLMLCDTVGRSLLPPYEIPVGIITGFTGGIFFLFFLVKR